MIFNIKIIQRMNRRNINRSQEHSQINERLNQEPTELQFKLDELLRQSAKREQKYISFIKQQQEALYQQSEQYLESLKKYQKVIEQKMLKNNGKKYQQYAHLNQMIQKSNLPVNKYNKTQFKAETAAQYQLHCEIKFIYLTPLIRDYLTQTYPKNIIIKAELQYPYKLHHLKTQVITQEQTQEAIIQNLLNGYPFQLLYQQNTNPTLNWVIKDGPQLPYLLKYMNHSLLAIQIYDEESQFLYCQGKLSLKQLLFYSSSKEERNQKTSFFKNGKKIANILIQFSNEVKVCEKSTTHKIQSQNPIEIKGGNRMKGDSETRIISRINKFKTNNTTLIPQMNPQNNDLTLMMHIKRKELESIIDYKNNHKEQYMDKILHEALQKYNTEVCQLGQIKFVEIKFTNSSNKVQKILLKEFNITLGQRIQVNQKSSWKFIQPQSLKQMLKNHNFTPKPNQFNQYEYNYDIDANDNSFWVGPGDTIALTYRFLVYSLGKEQMKLINGVYELQVQFLTEYGQLISKQGVRVKLRQPISDHTFTLNNYSSLIDNITIPFPNRQTTKFHATIPKLQYFLDKSQDSFQIKIQHPSITNNSQKYQYIFIYDNSLLKREKCYRICMNTFPEIPMRTLLFGQVGIFKLQVKGNQICKQNESRIKIATSDNLSCVATCEGQTELNIKKDKIYVIELKIQSLGQQNPLKILIHYIDKIYGKILKKSLLIIPIKFNAHKNQFKIYLPSNNPQTNFKFQLSNKANDEASYKFYTTNKCILSPPNTLIRLLAHQIIDVDIKIKIKKNEAFKDDGDLQNVIMVVNDGRQIATYLFQIQCTQ